MYLRTAALSPILNALRFGGGVGGGELDFGRVRDIPVPLLLLMPSRFMSRRFRRVWCDCHSHGINSGAGLDWPGRGHVCGLGVGVWAWAWLGCMPHGEGVGGGLWNCICWGFGTAISMNLSVTSGVKIAPPHPAMEGEASTWSFPL